MSSPTKRRSQRTSASATPRRSARGALPSSSPAPVGAEEQLQSEASQASQRGSQATPRNSRLQSASTQSPLFFRSSPGIPFGSGAGNDAPESDDGGATPRASGMNIGGMHWSTRTSRDNINVFRLLSHQLCLELQPWSRPQCAKH
jgi:DNA replication licensing factor MCM4